MFFIKEYNAKKIKEPDNFNNRKRILSSKNKNLIYLLNKRFDWMKKYISKKKNSCRARIWKWLFKKNNSQ